MKIQKLNNLLFDVAEQKDNLETISSYPEFLGFKFYPYNESLKKIRYHIIERVDAMPELLNDFHFVEEGYIMRIDTAIGNELRLWDTICLRNSHGTYIRVSAYKNAELFIPMVLVQGADRGKGIGSALMNFMLQLILNVCDSCPRISLEVTQRPLVIEYAPYDIHQTRMEFFRRFGFRCNQKLSKYPLYNLMVYDPNKYNL
jgi:GNAT superfamily N-acetyltransferase